jgi:hypothetical protein
MPFHTAAAFTYYFEANGYKNPSDAFDGPHQFAKNTKQHVFEWMGERPKIQNAFNKVMGMSIREKVDFYQMYPVAERLQVSSPEEVMIVDVGGGLGHELAGFRKSNPDLQGKVILEDLPNVIDEAKKKGLADGVEAIGHDFFEPQPVKGAKAYHLRTILHDWPDKQARTILQHITDVMKDDSVLLINEQVVPESGVSFKTCTFDMVMMTMAGTERTEAQFKALLDSAGLELIKIWRPSVDAVTSCLIEARKKRS